MSASAAFKSGQVALSDGVRLSYLEAGSGKPLVMVPGWSRTAIEFKHQLAGLSGRTRVITYDPRGQGGPTSRITAIICRGLPWICARCSTRLLSTR
jgi:pimeloyl-ACP methyl ester carboxylesterase